MQFKHQRDKDLFYLLHPLLIMVIGDMNLYCHDNNLPFVITETVTTLAQDKKLKRVSSSHREKRSFDSSLRGWEESEIKTFIAHFSEKYKDIAAISGSTFKPRLIVRHNSGAGDHMHFQIHSKFTIK